MAANKFATMLHRNTNKITLILIYAVLEWILIILLLLNSLFSYLILKFADYFGLKRPCLWCSRLDHLLDPENKHNSYRDLVCETHAAEISRLGYCSNHRKLVESQDMCEDCSSSSQKPDRYEVSNKFAFFPWMNQIGMVQNGEEEEAVEDRKEDSKKCSCCGENLKCQFFPPCFLIKPSWEVLDYTSQKDDLIKEPAVDDQKINDEERSDRSRLQFETFQPEEDQDFDENRGIQMVSDFNGGSERNEEGEEEEEMEKNSACSVCDFGCREMGNEGNKVEIVVEEEKERVKGDTCAEFGPQKHLEFYIDADDCHLIPVELINSNSNEIQNFGNEQEQGNYDGQDVVLDFDLNFECQIQRVPESTSYIEASPKQVNNQEAIQTPLIEDFEFHETAAKSGGETHSSDVHQDFHSDEIEAEISIGTEIPEQEHIDEIHSQDILLSSYPNIQEDHSTIPELLGDDMHCSKQSDKYMEELMTLSMETTNEQAIHNEVMSSSEPDENTEEKVPDTPTSIESLHQLHKKLLLLDRKESGTEESLDGGSIISEIEGGDGVLTVEKLKSMLRAERKALNALYAELEEERSASAVAANQTMAMINRLQEEKATMQMEALQYQRMMDEQSEYDQEALQLLNELVVKREKEKQELEKQVELYQKKVQDYEAKEKMIMLRNRKDRSPRSSTTSSGSCTNSEDSDGLFSSSNNEVKEEDGFFGNEETVNHQNTPSEAVLYLEESLASFEDERLSILEQLKVLEEKLFTLTDEEEQCFDDIEESHNHLHTENGNGYHENSDCNRELHGFENGHLRETNGKHNYQERRITIPGPKAKRLLPLFDDVIEEETQDGISNGNEQSFESIAMQNSLDTKHEYKKLGIEEEVDHVYERLQALEADREFLKHCIGSLQKGGKGLELLHEILQHLRDLRSVDLRVKNLEDSPM